jgi:hypothetical protein
VKSCIACGMPMKEAGEFAGGDMSKEYCVHCSRPDGSMQSFQEKLESWTHFIVRTQGFDRKAAAEAALSMMKRLPAWKDEEETEPAG